MTEQHATAYAELRGRVAGLVDDVDPSALEQPAPATPGWRVRDVLAHMIGVTDDVVHGRLEGARPLHHVYRRAGRACHRCGGTIRSFPQGENARMAYWCPGCQKGGRQPKA
jgi:hypothetical protein